MNASFRDQEDPSNPLNGHLVASSDVGRLLRSLQTREPFFCSLEADLGTLLVGVGRELGCIQFTPKDGGLPYLMATIGSMENGDEYVEFLSGGTPSPVPRRVPAAHPASPLEGTYYTAVNRALEGAATQAEGVKILQSIAQALQIGKFP